MSISLPNDLKELHRDGLSETNLDSSSKRNTNQKKSYEVRGTRDESYLDLSKLMLVHPDGAKTSSSDSDSKDKRPPSDYFINQINSSKLTFRRTGEFASHPKTPLIYQGRYKKRPVSLTEITEKQNEGFSEMSFLESEISDRSIPSDKAKWKYILETPNERLGVKRRGYYSELVSPLLRPERILAARHKEMEELRRLHGMSGEEEKEGESDTVIEEYHEGYDKTSDVLINKAVLKDWPPIYKVLNAEQAFAEFEIPVTYKEPSLISRGRMPEYAFHLKETPKVSMDQNVLQPEENWVVYETEPNVVNIAFKK